jgi:hypothetical protein
MAASIAVIIMAAATVANRKLDWQSVAEWFDSRRKMEF